MRVYTVILFEDPLYVWGRLAEISAEKNLPAQVYFLYVSGDEHIEDEEIYRNPKLGNFTMVSFRLFFAITYMTVLLTKFLYKIVYSLTISCLMFK